MLAAVFCAAGAGSFVDTVVDKRKMLSDSLLTQILSSDDLITNRNGTGNLYNVKGSGTTSWADDTFIQRVAPATLRVISNINLDGDLGAGGSLTAQSLTVEGRIAGSNLRRGGTPSGPATLGDIQQSTDGRLYVYQSSGWQEIATVASAIPVGTVLTSLVDPTAMVGGWLVLDGTAITESTYATPFAIPALAPYITGGSAPTRTMTLPDALGQRMLLGSATAAVMGGMSSISVLLANMPAHKHNVPSRTPTAA